MKVIQGTRECTPSDVGYEESRLGAVNEFFQRMIDNKVIHGVSYRLARNGKVFASAALGSRHYKKPDVLLKPETNFRIASQTKMFTAFAVQLLVVLIVDPVEKMVCSCVYPWVADWDAACNGRLSNVIWSGII